MSAVIQEKNPIIYFDNKGIDLFSSSSQQIGHIWGKIARIIEGEREENLFDRLREPIRELGFNPERGRSYPRMVELARKIVVHERQLQIVPSSREESGVYFIHAPGAENPIAVFKIGAKRTRSEQAAYEILTHFGLEDHVATGLFCAIRDPQFKGETTEELYNGNVKVFVPDDEADQTDGRDLDRDDVQALHNQLFSCGVMDRWNIVDSTDGVYALKSVLGIIEPYEEPGEEPLIADQFFSLVLAMVLINGRDIKKDALIGAKMCDTAENMGEKVDPRSGDVADVVLATHLPLLDHPLSQERISAAHLAYLYQRICNVNGFEIQKDVLGTLRILFPDYDAEEMEIEAEGKDQGNLKISIARDENQIPDISPIKQIDPNVPESLQLYSGEQINAFGARLTRLQDFLRFHRDRGTSPTPWELVIAIDPAYQTQLRFLKERGLSDQEAFDRIGRMTPSRAASHARRSSSGSRSSDPLPNGSPVPTPFVGTAHSELGVVVPSTDRSGRKKGEEEKS